MWDCSTGRSCAVTTRCLWLPELELWALQRWPQGVGESRSMFLVCRSELQVSVIFLKKKSYCFLEEWWALTEDQIKQVGGVGIGTLVGKLQSFSFLLWYAAMYKYMVPWFRIKSNRVNAYRTKRKRLFNLSGPSDHWSNQENTED